MAERLTVLLPARNAEETIRTSVSSVLRALPSDGKLLILDDASSDATGEILGCFARVDGRVGVLKSDKQLGIAGALNVLVDAADTPLIGRMDADDIALPWLFRRQIPMLYRRGLDAIFSPMIMFGPSPLFVAPEPPLYLGPAASPYDLLLTCGFQHPTIVARKSIIVGAGCYRRVPAEDWDLWIRMALRGGRLCRIAFPALLNRRHAGSTTASKAWQKALAQSVETALVHEELSQKLLGFGKAGAYAALTGPWAGPNDVDAAINLIDAVRTAANSLPVRDRFAVRASVIAATRKVKGFYGDRD